MPNVLRGLRVGPILVLSLAAITLPACAYDEGYDHHRHYHDDGYYSRDRDDYEHGRYRVCDPDGDRCYRSSEPTWDYHEYYRRQGYHWEND